MQNVVLDALIPREDFEIVSLPYYENYISEQQRKIAEKTRKLVKDKIGSFREIMG